MTGDGGMMPVYFSSERVGETLVAATRDVLVSPVRFFEAMPGAADYRNSLVLLCIYLTIPALVLSLFSGIVTIVFILPATLVFGIFTTWMWAWYLGWASRVFCKAELNTPGAFQICAYSSAPLLLSWVPVFGVVAYIWNLYLNWQGLVSHARVGGGAALMFILGAFVVFGLSLLLFLVLLFKLTADSGMPLPPMMSTFIGA